jgi:hypothetical protein
VLGTQSVGRALEILGELLNCLEIALLGSLGIVTALEFFEHNLA